MADVKPIANDPVAGLIDIPLPKEISLWPETWALRIAIVLLLVAAVVAIWQFVHYRRVNRYRREALSELTRITQPHDVDRSPSDLATQLSLLVRRTALAAYPRNQVAPLMGSAWLAFLDRTGDETRFSAGVGRWLASAPYVPAEPDANQSSALVELVRRWIRVHHV
ncbi:DUF4381 domain-containing protein [Bradyrhizobium sp. Ai1a-2]|uniref:DUF4381 domain-containing protein n=1 Tax=Bradyrhizobium sp. Ai1a-2 TaxID=196490 RepID=UPI000421AE77|nr:DUF4381 domain-containing protein [Bradyrhizobium sp. Ai1a-2]